MKRILISTIQILVTLGLLWWIFSDPRKRAEMGEAIRNAEIAWLVAGVVCIGAACILQTERWRILLAVQGIRMGWLRTFRVFLIGAFFNLFLLGATGGDIVKIFYAMRETASKSAAFLSVLVDRMMGLLGLVVTALALSIFRLDLLLSQPVTRALVFSLVMIVSAALAMIVTGFILDRFNLAHKVPSWFPLRAKFLDFAAAFSTYARNPSALSSTLGLSVLSHLCNFGAFYLAARSFGLFEGWSKMLDFFCVLPPILTVAALPVSLSGIGVREKLFENVFHELFGTPEATAAMISISGFMMFVFWGLIGGVIYMMYRPTGGIHLGEVQEEVVEAEHIIEEKA